MSAEVGIIGAGVVGASTALSLARRGRRVLVIDKAAGPGYGSTSASSAIIRFNYSTWEGVAASWESRFRWDDWAGHLGGVDPAGMARFSRCGMLFLDAPQAPWRRSGELFDRAGIPWERWEPADLAARMPWLDTGSYYPPRPVDADDFGADASGSLGAVWTPDAGYVDDPRLAAANLAWAAGLAGADFRYRQTVTGISRAANRWVVQTGEHTAYEVDVLVNAAGPWSGAVNAMSGAATDFAIGTRPLRQEVHQLPGPAGVAAGTVPVISDMDLGTYVRPEPTGSILIGGTEPECDPLEWLDDPDTADPGVTLERYEAQATRVARRLPTLRVPNRPTGIAGVYDASDDWVPIYDRTALPGYYVAMGTSGNQFKNAPLVGDLMATIVEGVESGHPHDTDPLTYTCPHTGHVLDLGAFSRRRQPNPDTSGTVMG